MEKTLQKYGIGIFVRPPAAPDDLPAGFAVSAPAGIEVDIRETSAFVRVPDGFAADDPVRLVSSGRGLVTLDVGKGSSVRVVEEASGARELGVALNADESSSVAWRSVQHAGREGDAVRREAVLARGARVEWTDVLLGSGFARSFTTTRLAGEGAEVRARGVFLGSGRDEYDVVQEAVHEAPRTVSDLSVRGALRDSAKAVFRGMVRIPRGMAGCSGRQEAHGLLLSPKAEFCPVPQLEIGNDDVRCAHAASVSRPDADRLFYLMSRGLSPDEATKLLLEGFLSLDDESLAEKVMAKLAV